MTMISFDTNKIALLGLINANALVNSAILLERERETNLASTRAR